MNTFTWYQKLIKPSWAPPPWLFGPVWTVLYIIIAISFGTVFFKVATKQLPWVIALPFLFNLIFNIAFSPLQFQLQNNFLASIDILLILITLIWSLIIIYPHISWITFINIPYVLWVAFASILQLSITYLNR